MAMMRVVSVLFSISLASDVCTHDCKDATHLLQNRVQARRLRAASEPNPPEWPSSVVVFGPEDTDMEQRFYDMTRDLLDLHTGHFSSKRLAFLFKPGVYSGNFKVGYYVQVLGLGTSASDVVFNGQKGVWAPAMDPTGTGSLDTFWRSAENFKSDAWEGMRWAVSQAAPVRRVHVKSQLFLHNCGFGACSASGGFMANMVVGGQVDFGSQQQWFSRNVEFQQGAHGGAWNLAFVGSPGAPASSFPEDASIALTNVPSTPVRAEKPFISIGEDGRYSLHIPQVEFNSSGAQLDVTSTVRSVPFEEVYVARDTDPDAIQAKLDAGYHVVVSPGIYNLSDPLTLKRPGQTLLGLGLATLMAPKDGSPCVRVQASVPGVRVAGLMLGASTPNPGVDMTKSTLLEWGQLGDKGNASDPGFLFDIFARVGGDFATAEVDTVMKINSGHVVGDHLWLWRADHAKLKPGEAPGWDFNRQSSYHLVTNDEAKANHGLEVYGDDVIMYGLQVEHFLQDQTSWHGERGRTYFYQCELPYDVTQEMFADGGYVGYAVSKGVKAHRAYGIGIYTYFRDSQVLQPIAVKVPERCFQAKPGTVCHDHITRVQQQHGIPGLPDGSSPEEIQRHLFETEAICGEPCSPGETDGIEVMLANVFTIYLNGLGGVVSIMGFEQANATTSQIAGRASTEWDRLLKRLPYGLATEGSEIDKVVSSLAA